MLWGQAQKFSEQNVKFEMLSFGRTGKTVSPQRN